MSDDGMSDGSKPCPQCGVRFGYHREGCSVMAEYVADAIVVSARENAELKARIDASERERDHYRKLAFGRIDQSAANGWMPIACAPTNGSKIDLWSESHYGNGRIPDAWYVGNEWFVLNGNGRPEAIAHHHNVTHWRPIHALTANHSAPVVEQD